ncbi:MAG: hypothetical protein QNJ12_17165 [Ilumatobacter sp.]|uniref:hypothetical protein n=1 Tax=Ilumatobacter sp. TaxID=1967498 RepID=UPI002601B8A3|nr:hypothetical protein [Ilumatobacter sp.]MDJ0770527.1 hypothetical protein [Ilumatobacter sp.]
MAALRQHVDSTILTVAILEGCDHPLQRDGELIDGYADHLLRFMTRVTRPKR